MEKLTLPRTVFVYGTLKRRQGNHPILGDSPLIGEATLCGDYRMYSLGGFPAITSSETPLDGPKVSGELYQVNCPRVMQSLDWLEGYNSDTDSGMYLRREAEAELDVEGARVRCETYLWNEETDGLDEITSRNW